MVFKNISVLRTKVASAMEGLMVKKPKVSRDRLWPNVYDAWLTSVRSQVQVNIGSPQAVGQVTIQMCGIVYGVSMELILL